MASMPWELWVALSGLLTEDETTCHERGCPTQPQTYCTILSQGKYLCCNTPNLPSKPSLGVTNHPHTLRDAPLGCTAGLPGVAKN